VKRAIAGTLVLGLAVGGVAGYLRAADAKAPAAPGTPPPLNLRPEAVVATVAGKAITFADLQRSLIEGYGLRVLVPQIMLTVAQEEAKKQGVTVTDADFAAELMRTQKAMFEQLPEADYPAALEQYLSKQGVTRSDFDMALQTNAILRKIAEPAVRKQVAELTEEKLKEAFNALYGETVIVRHIQLLDPQQGALAKSRLAAGERFESLVRAMSQNRRTIQVDGELPQFSRQTESWGGDYGKVPQGFKDWAFAPGTKVGDVSDIIQVSHPSPSGDTTSFHVLKLEQRNAPKIAKFDEPTKQFIKNRFEATAMEKGINALRYRLAEISRASLKIEEPTLARQYAARLAEQQQQAPTNPGDADKMRKDLLNGKTPGPTTPRVATEPPADQSGTQGTPPATPGGQASPAKEPAGERPPAIKSAAPGAADRK
jgi:hypothetical protein